MAEVADRLRRHRLIREIVERESVRSQEALGEALAALGVGVTQSTLSRDLRELHISRVPTDDGFRYVPREGGAVSADEGGVPGDRLRRVASLEVVSVDANEQLVVVRTLTGRAQGVAVTIDELRLGDVLGTIAGDDTILVVPRRVRATERLRERLATALGIA